jgi:cytidylate kinase
MAVITISRQFGAGGLTLGQKVAQLLGYTFISDEIITLVAKKARVSSDWVEVVEKEAGGRLQKFLNTLVPRAFLDRILDPQAGYIDEEIFIDLLGQIVNQIADEGNCVILGRGGQYILKNRPDVFHVLLIAEPHHRIEFMQHKYRLSPALALQTVTAEDKRRTNFYHKFNKTDYDRPEHYHLTLNTGRIDLDRAAEIIRLLIMGR